MNKVQRAIAENSFIDPSLLAKLNAVPENDAYALRIMILDYLKHLEDGGSDTECDHSDADTLLCILLGDEEIYNAWHSIPKWFA